MHQLCVYLELSNFKQKHIFLCYVTITEISLQTINSFFREISNERDEICTTESNEEESISHEEFTPPSNKRSKIMSIVTLNSDEKVQLNLGNNVTVKLVEKSISMDSSKLEDNSLQKSESIVNEVPFIEEKNDEKNVEAELHNSLRKDQMPNEIDDKQLEKIEIRPIDLDNEENVRVDHSTNLQQGDNNTKTLEKKEDVLTDHERLMSLDFCDVLNECLVTN